jgi:class 3 adenylate cyclase
MFEPTGRFMTELQQEHQELQADQAREPVQALVAARAALAQHEWRAAFDALTAADATEPLAPEGLELLAQAAWWTGQLPVAIEVRERAFAAALKAGDQQAAVIFAINLARDHLFRLATSVSQAWLRRAEQMLAGMDENPGHGWLAGIKGAVAAQAGDNDEALAQATLAQEIAVRLGIRDLEALAMGARAAGLLAHGDLEEGLALADQATIVALSGELPPAVAGGVFCQTIEACASIGDQRRAIEWIDAQDRWCKREGINGYPGMCRLFRSDIKRQHGSWPEAEAEARQASVELRGYIPGAAGLALYQVGVIRLERGDLPAAEEALLGAYGLGHNTEPALSLLRLRQGKPEEAAASIQRALVDGHRPSWGPAPGSPVARIGLLSAKAEILLGSGDLPGARQAADELAALSGRFTSPIVQAKAASADGAVLLAEGNVADAAARLREAVALWNGLEAPYDAGRARLLLTEAYRRDGAPDRAAIEARTARDAFEQLGAALDLRRAEAALLELSAVPGAAPLGTSPTRAQRVFVFTDIVDSTRLAESLGDEAWDGVIRMHDRVVRAAVAEQGGEEVKGTGDGFFLAFGSARQALDAAIAIQRRLAERRREGFAPAVRIGIHGAEVNRVGLDYVGTGVNRAARVGAAAEGGEILISAPTLKAARRAFAERSRRTVKLKGLRTAATLVSIDWS